MSLRRSLPLIAVSIAACLGAAASAQSTADFRVLPYQMNPALDGMQLTWFTISGTPGTLTVSGPGLKSAVVLTSTPELDPVLDYQIAAELNAAGASPSAPPPASSRRAFPPATGAIAST